jgi:putative tryptophan/tyrosine transport system substrate-binding protein
MPVTIGRRKLMAAMGCAAVTCPLAARAQQPAMPVIGWISSKAASESAYLVTAFRRDSGLAQIEGFQAIGTSR